MYKITSLKIGKCIGDNSFKNLIKLLYHQIQRKNEKDVFNVAFVGVMLPHKGSKVLEYFVKHCKDRNIKFHLFGIAHSDLLKKNHSNYEYHGVYKRNELPRLLKENSFSM